MFDSEVEGFVARMLLAVTYALTDAINVLLIGVLVVIGVLLPPRSRYNRIATLLIAGDWLGVFLYALVCMLVFDGIGAPIKRLVESSIFGIITLNGIPSIFNISCLLGDDEANIIGSINILNISVRISAH